MRAGAAHTQPAIGGNTRSGIGVGALVGRPACYTAHTILDNNTLKYYTSGRIVNA